MGKSTLEHLVAGYAVGAGTLVDPIGSSINYVDRWLTGAGTADKERAIPTVKSHIVQQFYNDYKEKLPGSAYGARFGGALLGGATIAAAAYAAPVVVGLGMIGTGIYGAARAIGRYATSFVNGETIGGKKQKSSFYDGFKFGWHRMTYRIPILSQLSLFGYTANPGGAHDLESSFTGRGLDQSHYGTKITSSAGGMRRNFAGIVGSAVGSIVGAFANVFSLGIVPIYKSIRDTYRTSQGNMHPSAKPAYNS